MPVEWDLPYLGSQIPITDLHCHTKQKLRMKPAQAATKTVLIRCYKNLSCSGSYDSNNQVSASRISLGPANIMYDVQTVLCVHFVVFLGYQESWS